MSDFYALRHTSVTRDMSILKELELKQRQLEEKALHSKKNSQPRRFRAHPTLIHHSDSDTTTASCTPRIKTNKYSSSTTNLVKGNGRENTYLEDTKQRAHNFHKLLHEKLSIIDRNSSDRTDFSDMGDSYSMTQKTSSNRFQKNRARVVRSDSSIGSLSLDSDMECNNTRSRSSDIQRSTRKENKRIENNFSCASKTTSCADGDKRSSRLSSQQSCYKRGIPGFVFERKFKVLVTKSLESIIGIRNTLIKGIDPPDGEDDESRRATRVKEFLNRFSRNSLYPLGRHLNDLNNIDQINPLVVNQKLLSTYQILHNALQAYQTHLPTSLGDCTYNQLKILMGNVVKVCDIHRNYLKKGEEAYIIEFIDAFKVNAELAIQKVDEFMALPVPTGTNVALNSEQSKISLTKYGGKNYGKPQSADKSGAKKGKMDKRLSMYTMTASFRKDAPWKRAVECLARKRFNVKSKYKTATYKHRPPVQKEPPIGSLAKLKSFFPVRQSGELKTTRLNSPINEDRIKTMVETEMNDETHVEKEEWEDMEKKSEDQCQVNSNKEEILMKLLQFTMKNHTQGASETDKSKISEIITLIQNEPNKEFLNKIIHSLTDTYKKDEKTDGKETNNEIKQLTLEIPCVPSQGSLSEGEKSRRKEPKVTVTGDRNTRLICITDDNSIIEPSQEDKPIDNKVCQTDYVQPAKVIVRTSSETQTEIQDNKLQISKMTQKSKNTNIKISRLKKSGKPLEPLSKKQAVDAIQYKLDFYRFCKENPMYKRSTTCQPWIVMSKISEDLLNQCLLAVAREIEVNDIAEKVYQAELQL